VKARHPAAGKVVVKAHLVIEGILVEHQRLRDCLCTGPDEGGVTEKTSLFPATRGPLMKFICFK